MRKIFVLLIGLALMIPAVSSAQLTVMDGAPYASTSWSQNFGSAWGTGLSQLRVDWVSGSQMSSPFLVSSTAGWSQLTGSSTLAAIGSSNTPNVIWTITLQDPMSSPAVFTAAWYSAGSYIGTETFTWSGSFWSIAWDPSHPDPGAIPEPGTLALLGLGIIGLGVVRRKRSA